jgi:hypothetical protein
MVNENGQSRKYESEGIEDLIKLESKLYDGEIPFTVMPISFRVKKVELVANASMRRADGRKRKRDKLVVETLYYNLIFPEEERQVSKQIGKRKVVEYQLIFLELLGSGGLHFTPLTQEERKEWNLEMYIGDVNEWVYRHGAENRGDVFRGYIVQPREGPLLVESTFGNHYAIAGGLSDSKILLDELLEKEGFYDSRAKVIRENLISKVMRDIGLNRKSIDDTDMAKDLIKRAFYRQYTISDSTPEQKKGSLKSIIGGAVKKVLNGKKKPLNLYLRDLHTYISLSITLDYKHVDTHVKPGIASIMPLKTYKTRIQQNLASILGLATPYLTPKK